MNYYLNALLELKINELKSKEITILPIDTVIKLLSDIQKINKGEPLENDF